MIIITIACLSCLIGKLRKAGLSHDSQISLSPLSHDDDEVEDDDEEEVEDGVEDDDKNHNDDDDIMCSLYKPSFFIKSE